MHPARIDSYDVEAQLGAGAMGAVYRVRRDGRVLALKWMFEQFASNDEALARFEREVEAGRTVDHPNVVRTLDAGRHDGRPFLVMELVEGHTLRQLLRTLARLPETLLREIARQCASGLEAIHDAGIVHRDLKPENVLVTDANEIRIMDLGVAKLQDATVWLTQTGAFAGSPLYASPEQLRDASQVDARSDLYSLGMLLYELATGIHPFAGQDLFAIIASQVHQVPDPLDARQPDVSPFFAGLVAALIEKRPDDRVASAGDLRSILREQEASSWWATQVARATATLRPRVPVARATPLIGRATARAAIDAAWAQACEGRGGILALEGESGIGKTRLLDAFLQDVSPASAHLLYGSLATPGSLGGLGAAFLDHYEGPRLDAALARHLAPHAAVLPALAAHLRQEPLPPGTQALREDAQHTLLLGLVHGMAEERPLLWVMDDAHLARPEAQAALGMLARGVAGHRVLIVTAAEPGAPELPGARAVVLGRLDEDEILALLRALVQNEELADRLAPRVAEASDGIPLYVLELVRALEETGLLARSAEGVLTSTGRITEIPTPGSIRDVLDTRLRELADGDRDLLDAASVQGRIFDPGLVAAVLDLKHVHVLRRLAALERSTGMVHADGDRYRFDRRQLQETLYTELPSRLRREYHALTADAHRDALGNEIPPAEAAFLASHALRGGRREQARTHLEPALAWLRSSFRYQEHAELARLAIETPDLLEGKPRVETLLDMAMGLDVAAARSEQRGALEEARRLAEALGEGALLAKARWHEGVLQVKVGRYQEAEPTLVEAARLASTAGDADLEARIVGILGTVLDNTGRHEEALPLLERHLEAAREGHDEAQELIASCNLGLALEHLDRIEESRGRLLRTLELARSLGDKRAEAIACGNLGLIAARVGDHEEAERLDRQNLALAREIGDRRSEMIAAMNLGNRLRLRGRLEEAGPLLERAFLLSLEMGDRRLEGRIEVNRAALLWDRRDLEAALVHMERAIELAEETRNPEGVAQARAWRAKLLAQIEARDAAATPSDSP